MKKLLALLLTFVCILGLTRCGKDKTITLDLQLMNRKSESEE